MRHDWMFDVLADVQSFAQINGLPALAAQVESCDFASAKEEVAVKRQTF